MKSLSLVCFLVCLIVASSRLSFKSQLKKSESCSKSHGFGSNSFIKVYLISDIGLALARCNGCGSAAYPNSAGVHGNIGDSFAIWKLYPGCNGAVALQADSGLYLGRCNGCWNGEAYPNSAFVHVTDPTVSYGNWLMINNDDGTYSFQSDTGDYLARCNGCVTGGAKPNFAFVHATSDSVAYAKWKIQLA